MLLLLEEEEDDDDRWLYALPVVKGVWGVWCGKVKNTIQGEGETAKKSALWLACLKTCPPSTNIQSLPLPIVYDKAGISIR